MQGCQNKEHKQPCSENAKCEYCGLSTCTANFAYHVCVAGINGWLYIATRTQQVGPVDAVVKLADKTVPLHHAKLVEYGRPMYHSPDGFNFGYAGSGPADLAHSILFDYFTRTMPKATSAERRAKAYKLHQAFKFHFVSAEKSDKLIITSKNIQAWLNSGVLP